MQHDANENDLSEEDLLARKAVLDDVRESIRPILQEMANASVAGDFRSWTAYSNEVLKYFTELLEPEMLANGQVLPPWRIPMHDIQMIYIHTQLGMIMNVLSQADVFKVALVRKAQSESSGLVGADGRPILKA